MRYLCLGYYDQEKMNALSKESIDAIMANCRPHMTEFYGTGRVTVDSGLAPNSKCLRRENGVVTVGEGPLVDSKLMIGSVFLIEATDLSDAVRIALLHPTTQVPQGEDLGWAIEIRPIHYFRMPDKNT